jgi:hypothetical protein
VVFEIAVEGDGRDLVRLRDWLTGNPAIRRTATVRLTAPAAVPGAMGSTAELITVSAGLLLDVGSLVVAIAAFRQSRRTVTSVKVRRGDVEVTITGSDRVALDDVIKCLEAAQPTDSDGGER